MADRPDLDAIEQRIAAAESKGLGASPPLRDMAACVAYIRQLEEAVSTAWHMVSLGEGETHQGAGQACGTDPCALCLAEGTLEPFVRRLQIEVES